MNLPEKKAVKIKKMYLLKKPSLNSFSKVKTHTRKGKKGTFVVREFDRKDRNKKIAKTTAATIATVVGVPVLTYLALRGRYRSNMANTLKVASKKAENMVLDIPNKSKSVTIGFGGFSGQIEAKNVNRKLNVMLKKLKPKSKVIMLENKTFNTNVPYSFNDKRFNYSQVVNVPKLIFNTIIKQGKNPEVENVLATALTAHRQRPDLPINLFSISAGGMVVQEVSEHLTKLGIPHKGITIGTGSYGLVKPNKSVKNFTNKLDPVTMFTPSPNTTYVNSGKGHNFTSYFTDNKIRDDISKYFS